MTTLKDVQNIIFDLGGVILNIDYQLSSQAFQKLGMQDFDNFYSQTKQTSIFDDFEIGKINATEFRERIKMHLPHQVSDQQINDAWNAMLLNLPQKRLEFLAHLKKSKRLFLLSNTNEIHIQQYEHYLNSSYGFANLAHLFEKEYYSYKIGKRKPDDAVFKQLIDEQKLNPSATLFVDDSRQHIEGASKTGLKTLWLAPGKDITQVLI